MLTRYMEEAESGSAAGLLSESSVILGGIERVPQLTRLTTPLYRGVDLLGVFSRFLVGYRVLDFVGSLRQRA